MYHLHSLIHTEMYTYIYIYIYPYIYIYIYIWMLPITYCMLPSTCCDYMLPIPSKYRTVSRYAVPYIEKHWQSLIWYWQMLTKYWLKRTFLQKKACKKLFFPRGRMWGSGIPILSTHIYNDMNINMNIDLNIDINIHIDIIPHPSPHPRPGPSAGRAEGGGAWGGWYQYSYRYQCEYW